MQEAVVQAHVAFLGGVARRARIGREFSALADHVSGGVLLEEGKTLATTVGGLRPV